MGEQGDPAPQDFHQDHAEPQVKLEPDLQAQDDEKFARDQPAATADDSIAQDAQPTPLSPPVADKKLTSFSGDNSRITDGEAAFDKKRVETKAKQLTVALKLSSDKLASIGSSVRVNADTGTSNDLRSGHDDGLKVSPTTLPSRKQTPCKDDQLWAEIESLAAEAMANGRNDVLGDRNHLEGDATYFGRSSSDPAQSLSNTGPAEYQVMGNAPQIDGQIVSNEANGSQMRRIDSGGFKATLGQGDAIVISSSPPRELSIKQFIAEHHDQAVESDSDISDEELIVVQPSRASVPDKNQRTGRHGRNAAKDQDHTRESNTPAPTTPTVELQSGLINSFNVLTPSSFQESHTAVTSPQGTRQAMRDYSKACSALNQSKATRLPQDVAELTKQEYEQNIKRLEDESQHCKDALRAARAKTLEKAGNLVPGRAPPPTLMEPPPPDPMIDNASYTAQGLPQLFPLDSPYGQSEFGLTSDIMASAHFPLDGYAPQATSGMLHSSMEPMTPEQYHEFDQRLQVLQNQHHRNALAQTQRQSVQDQDIRPESDSRDVPMMSRSRGRPSGHRQGPKQTTDNTMATQPTSDPASSSPAAYFDFSLPQFEVQSQPLDPETEVPSAKVSIPGLVREELLLSPDHADQELHLLCALFLPNQQLLPEPDPEPAAAVLNFHNIAVMVIEAYVHFEIGDEYGTGRGHWHDSHDQDDEAEYVRAREAKDADPNDIFFAVIDRWRAGIESGRKGMQLIRGAQEFCDIALDIIYYVKENGLLRPEPKPKKTRGKGKGKKDDGNDDEGGGTKGKKRGAQKVVNEVQPRKKAKATPAKTTTAKSKPKATVQVVKKAKK